MFRTLISPVLPDWHFQTIALEQGERLPDPAGLDAALITGSPAGIYDDTPWMQDLMDFIRWSAHVRLPQIGICFGHQAIAHALGAQVRKSAKGWGIGRHQYEITCAQDWMGTPPPQVFSLGVSHQDQVETLPPGAVHLAGNAFCEYAALAYPAIRALSFQGHPEFSPEFSLALYQVRQGHTLSPQQVLEARRSFENPVDNQQVGGWIAKFLRSGSAI